MRKVGPAEQLKQRRLSRNPTDKQDSKSIVETLKKAQLAADAVLQKVKDMKSNGSASGSGLWHRRDSLPRGENAKPQ